MTLDTHLNTVRDDSDGTSELEVSVDWAPAYELLISFQVFLWRGKHPLLELGQTWVDDAHFRLPADFQQRARSHAATFKKNNEDDLLALLVRVCPVERDADSWLRWLAELTPGGAYELLAQVLPESGGAALPRDFVGFRERMVGLLRTWHTHYFAELEPAVLDGLQAEAERVRALIPSQPARELVEQVTNGMFVESGPARAQAVLVPQHHLRPYIHDCPIAQGIVLLYPADILPAPPETPPTALLRLTRGLSDDSRLRILRFVASGPRSLTEVARFAGLSQPTVHHHLTQLRTAGLVRVHRSLAGPSRFSLRSHALEQLARDLGAYLEGESPS